VGLPENPDRVALDVAAVHVPGLQPRPARPADATMMGFGPRTWPFVAEKTENRAQETARVLAGHQSCPQSEAVVVTEPEKNHIR
jgi:hypothetical protein